MGTEKDQIRAAISALVSIANGAPWQAYAISDSDTRSIVTERLATKAMSMVEALVKDGERLLYPLTEIQWHILKSAERMYGTSIGTWEEQRMKLAQEMVDQGLMNKELELFTGRSYLYHVTLEGRRALAWKMNSDKSNSVR